MTKLWKEQGRSQSIQPPDAGMLEPDRQHLSRSQRSQRVEHLSPGCSPPSQRLPHTPDLGADMAPNGISDVKGTFETQE